MQDEHINERTALLRSGTNSCDVTNNPPSDIASKILAESDGYPPIREKVTTGLGRFFLIELALTLFFLSDFPLTIIMQKYIVDWTTKEFIRRDALHNITHTSNGSITPCTVNISGEDYHFQQSIQSRASMISAVESVTRGVPAIFSCLIIGAASDRYGRRWALLPPCFGMLSFSIAVFVVTRYSLPVWYVFIADLCYGFTGSVYGMIMACTAYIADFTTQERLAVRFGVLYFCALVPTIISSEAVGPLVASIGYSNAALITVAILSTNLLYVLIFLREAPRDVARTEAKSSVLDVVGKQISSALSIIRGDGPLGRYRSARFCLLVMSILFSTIASTDTSVNALFAMNSPLCWDLKTIGLYTGILIATFAIGSVGLMPLQKKFLEDNAIALIATVAAILASVYKFFVRSTMMMFFVPAFGFFIIQVYPCIRSMLSVLAGRHRQGAVFGLVSVIEVICSIVGAVTLNSIYSGTLYIATGFVFLFVALLYTITLAMLIIHYVILKKEASAAAKELNEEQQKPV